MVRGEGPWSHGRQFGENNTSFSLGAQALQQCSEVKHSNTSHTARRDRLKRNELNQLLKKTRRVNIWLDHDSARGG